ncbi:dolichyl-phosphate-mannose--protein mannosyltransferase [Isoptericola halotolerans]|uniref:Polyprenol-phosphate-mannose--protein mannosyltransferase n=1 Tax=Isoptericola halotolerans TaxID=300560 RepID=A0ABX2A3T8_9MICO|nr:dolichyl-phosphate-mannose--protein O-mannosyl transferase [Isoptericola halotolerans]
MSAPDADAPTTGDTPAVDTPSEPRQQYPSRRDVHGHRRTDTRGIPVVTGAIRALTGAVPSVGQSGGQHAGPRAGTTPAGSAAPAADPPDLPPSGTEGPAQAEGPTGMRDEPATTERTLLVRLLGERRLALGATRQARALGWAGAVMITLLAAVARLWELGKPGTLVFDETYYVKDAYTLGREGSERQWPDDPDPAFEAGDVDTYLDQAAYVVHPPVGKWMIWLGMEAGGGATDPFAWRLASAVVGILAVLLLARIARRLFSSTVMGLAAGFLLAIDGQAIVHSRTALLDQFLMFWVLVAFGCLLLDREQARRRLAAGVAAVVGSGGSLSEAPRWLGARWWRLAAGVSLGLACGVKWSGLWFVAVFGLLTVLWDVTARRRAGIPHGTVKALAFDAPYAFVQVVPVALVTYVASWWSWIASAGSAAPGYYRTWATDNPDQATWVPDWLESLWHYHQQMLGFHTGLDSEHAYAAHPWGWIVQWRPTSFFWERSAPGQEGCPVDADGACAVAVTALGNPLLWFLAAIAIVVTIVLGVWLRDWRALAVLSGTIAGWAPWFLYTDRTIFAFYSIVFTPWVILTLLYPMVVALERTARGRGRGGAIGLIAGVLLVIAAVSVAFYPFWSAMQVPYDYWREVIRFRNWV